MLKLFSIKPTWNAVKGSGVSVNTLQKLIYFLNQSLEQLATVQRLKPTDQGVSRAIDKMNQCLQGCDKVAQEFDKVLKEKTMPSEGPSLNKGP